MSDPAVRTGLAPTSARRQSASVPPAGVSDPPGTGSAPGPFSGNQLALATRAANFLSGQNETWGMQTYMNQLRNWNPGPNDSFAQVKTNVDQLHSLWDAFQYKDPEPTPKEKVEFMSLLMEKAHQILDDVRRNSEDPQILANGFPKKKALDQLNEFYEKVVNPFVSSADFEKAVQNPNIVRETSELGASVNLFALKLEKSAAKIQQADAQIQSQATKQTPPTNGKTSSKTPPTREHSRAQPSPARPNPTVVKGLTAPTAPSFSNHQRDAATRFELTQNFHAQNQKFAQAMLGKFQEQVRAINAMPITQSEKEKRIEKLKAQMQPFVKDYIDNCVIINNMYIRAFKSNKDPQLTNSENMENNVRTYGFNTADNLKQMDDSIEQITRLMGTNPLIIKSIQDYRDEKGYLTRAINENIHENTNLSYYAKNALLQLNATIRRDHVNFLEKLRENNSEVFSWKVQSSTIEEWKRDADQDLQQVKSRIGPR